MPITSNTLKSTTSQIDLRKCIAHKEFNKLNTIGEIKITKPNCSICMEEYLATLKKYVAKVSHS